MDSNKIVFLEKSDTGATLATWLYCHMWQAYSAVKAGWIPYINWPKIAGRFLAPHADDAAFARCPNMYEWWFEQPFWKGTGAPKADATWEWERCQETGIYNLGSQPLAVIKAWYQQHLIFNQFVLSRAQALVAKYTIDFNNTLGLSWRGCDSTDDGRPRMPIETYFPFIDDILAKESCLRIFATAEEATVVDKVMARYPGRVFSINELFSAPWGYKGHSEFANPASGYERGMQTCLMIYTLSRCKHYVKNRSNSGGIASWLSNGNIVSLAHPETLAHGFDLRMAEVKGKLVPLQR